MAGAGEDLELLFHAERTNLLSRNDALVLALHSFLLDEGSRCVGKGEEWPTEEPGKGSKTLPRSWNEDQEKISLRYIKDDLKLTFSVFADGDNTMMTIKDEIESKTEGECLDVDSYVDQAYDNFSCYRNLECLRKIMKDQILNPLIKNHRKLKEEREKQRHSHRFLYNDDRDFHFMIPEFSRHPRFGMPMRPSPFDYGRSDLDPLGGPPGGGMLFDIPRPNRQPQIPGNMPRGAVPPGARFDPIGPFSGMPMPRPSQPDPDVGLPPPGYDDMFG